MNYKITFQILLFLFLLFNTNIQAQNVDFEWAKTFGSSQTDQARTITIDQLGNSYSVGIFRDTVDFDPSNNVFNLISDSAEAIYILKLDKDGNFIWAKSIKSTNNTNLALRNYSIQLDHLGNIYLAGDFKDTVDFDPSSGVFNLISKSTTINKQNGFILKLDLAGNFIWAKSIENNDFSHIRNINLDELGNVYLVGSFLGTPDFDPGNGVFNLAANGSFQDAFIMKLDINGDFVWAKSIGETTSYPYFYSINIDKQFNICLVGDFSGTIDFDPGLSIYNLTSNGMRDIFVLKLDNNGQFVWAKSIGGTGNDKALGKLDTFGNTYLTGHFQDTVDFDPSNIIYNLGSKIGYDGFLLKLDMNGQFIWCNQIKGTSSVQANSIYLDDKNNAYTIGSFRDTLYSGLDTLVSKGLHDIYLQKVAPNGNILWNTSLGGSGVDLALQNIVTPLGDIYIVGTYQDTVDFDFTNNVSYSISNGGMDAFILKLSQPNTITSLLPIAINQFDAERLSKDKVQLSWQVEQQETVAKFELERMLDGENVFKTIKEELATSSHFYEYEDENAFSKTSYYRLKIIEENGTFLYSSLKAVSGNNSTPTIDIYPNPIAEEIRIVFKDEVKNGLIQIVDINGRCCYKTIVDFPTNHVLQLNNLNLVSGTYIINIRTDKGNQVSRKFIKQ